MSRYKSGHIGGHWQACRQGGQRTPEMQRLPIIALLLPGHCKANAVCSLWCALHTVLNAACIMQLPMIALLPLVTATNSCAKPYAVWQCGSMPTVLPTNKLTNMPSVQCAMCSM